MHIAYLSPAWPPRGAANGVVTYVSVIRDYLLREGHDVSVLSQGMLHRADGSSHALDAPGAMPFWSRMAARIDRRLGHHPFTGRRMADQWRRARGIAAFDLIEMEESFGWCDAVRRRVDVPVVTRLHGPQFLKPPGGDTVTSPAHARDRERAEARAIRLAGALSAPTGVILDATRTRYRAALGKVIPNPVASVAPRDRWRLDACNRDMILCVGRLDRLKGADTMLAAFAQLLARRPTARLTMVGPDGGYVRADGTTIAFAEHAAATFDPATLSRVTFAGLLDRDAIAALRRQAFVTVVASVCENFPYAAVEAMAAGSPLVTTDWLGAAEIVTDGTTGWLTPVGDAPAMAERLAWLFERPDAAAHAGAQGWLRCREDFGVERVGARMVDFYREILARHRS